MTIDKVNYCYIFVYFIIFAINAITIQIEFNNFLLKSHFQKLCQDERR